MSQERRPRPTFAFAAVLATPALRIGFHCSLPRSFSPYFLSNILETSATNHSTKINETKQNEQQGSKQQGRSASPEVLPISGGVKSVRPTSKQRTHATRLLVPARIINEYFAIKTAYNCRLDGAGLAVMRHGPGMKWSTLAKLLQRQWRWYIAHSCYPLYIFFHNDSRSLIYDPPDDYLLEQEWTPTTKRSPYTMMKLLQAKKIKHYSSLYAKTLHIPSKFPDVIPHRYASV